MSAEAISTYYVVVEVPAAEWLTSNGRYHWASRARRTRKLRTRAALAARAARVPPMVRARITVYVHGRTRVRPDMRLGAPDSRLPTGWHKLTINITDIMSDKEYE